MSGESASAKKDFGSRTPQGEALNELILAIFRVNGRLTRVGDALSRELNLTSARWQVLGAIAHGPKTVAQIARHYELSRQGVLFVVRTMVKDNIVELIRNPDHQRARLVRLTKAGMRLYEEISRRQRSWVSELASSFPERELRAAIRLIERLGSELLSDQVEDDDDLP